MSYELNPVRRLCEQRLKALLFELSDYDSLTLQRGLSGVTSLSAFVESEFLNARHAELFIRIWEEWQRTWDSTLRSMASRRSDEEMHRHWGEIKRKFIHDLDHILDLQNILWIENRNHPIRTVGTLTRKDGSVECIA